MRKTSKRTLAVMLVIAMLVSMMPINGTKVAKAAGYSVSNPQISSGVTTWDCIYFGNYWQNDTNGDGTADKNDAKTPIKWRVLSVNGDDAFLVADKNIDVQQYNVEWVDVTWETCTMRSWLNGYGASSNACGTDYTSDNFLDNAFTASEQSAISSTTVVNDDNPKYGTEGGNDTTDKVYLLSIDEAMNTAYGFSASSSSETRESVNTAYAKASGAWTSTRAEYEGNGYWWLRSPGIPSNSASFVSYDGYVFRGGVSVDDDDTAVRPALHLNLSSSTSWSYAGTVTSDGVVSEEATPAPGDGSRTPEPTIFGGDEPTATPESVQNQASHKVAEALPDMGDLGSAELKGPEIDVAGNKFNLFKTNVSMSLPIFEDANLKISIDETERTAEVLIGLEGSIETDPDDPRWKETYQEVKSLVKACGGKTDTTKLWNQFSKLRGKLREFDGDAVFSVNGNSAGYIKLQLDENNNPISLIEGGVMAGLEASGKVKTPLWWIVYSEFGVGGSVDGKLCLTTENTETIQVKGELGLAIKPSVAIGADAVVVDIKGGIEGEIGGKVAIPWKSFEECVSAYLTGKLFIKVDTVVPGLSGGYDFDFPKLELYPELGKISQRSLSLGYSASEQATKAQIGEIKQYASANAVDTTKQSLVYENAKPEMVQLSDGKILMTYLDDTVSEAEGQAKLMYRLYSDGEWTDGRPVNDNTNLDTAGKLCMYDGKAYVLYENSSQTITEDMTQKQILDTMDLYVATFDAEKNAFETSVKLGEVSGQDSVWKYGYDFAQDDTGLVAVWAENSEGDVLLESGNTDIYQSELTSEGWQEKTKLASQTGTVQEFSVQRSEGTSQLAYIKDNELYVAGEKIALSGSKADSVKLFDDTLYFRKDGQLHSVTDGEVTALGVACTTSYRVVDGVVYWTEQDNFTSEIYRKGISSSESPVAVTDEGGYIGSFCLLKQSESEPLLAYTVQAVDETVESGSPYGLTMLKFSEDLSRNQAEVKNLAYDILSFTPGEDNDVAVTVQNTGTTDLTEVKVIICDAEGNVLHEEEISATMKPGEVLEKHLSVAIPEGMTQEEITATVQATETFAKSEDTAMTLQVEKSIADLELSQKDSDTVIVTNNAEEAAENVTLSVNDSDETGELLLSENIGTLQAGVSKEISLATAWSKSTSNEATGENYLYCDVTQDTMEYELWNNSLQLKKASSEIEPEPSATPAVSVTPEPSTSPTTSPELSQGPVIGPMPTVAPSAKPSVTPVVSATPEPSGTPMTSAVPTTSPDSGQGTTVLPPILSPQGPALITPTIDDNQTGVIAPDSSTAVKAPAKVTKVTLKPKKGKLQAKWKKVTGANGYEICYSTSKKFKKKKKLTKSKSTKKTKITIKKLKRGKRYFVRVRAYTLQDSKKVYGKWSKVKRVKIK